MFARIISPLLRIFFKLLYNQFAWSYDIVANVVSVGMWDDWVSSVLPEISGDKILELGHGPGHLQEQLLLKGKITFGIDLSSRMGKNTKKLLVDQALKYRLINADSRKIPLPSEHFDHVVATFPTEYIYSQSAAAEIIRILNPGGSLIIVPVAWIKPSNVMRRMASILFRVTGQAGEWDDKYLKPFIEAGLQVHITRVKLNNSTVLHIHGVKPSI